MVLTMGKRIIKITRLLYDFVCCQACDLIKLVVMSSEQIITVQMWTIIHF